MDNAIKGLRLLRAYGVPASVGTDGALLTGRHLVALFVLGRGWSAEPRDNGVWALRRG